MDFHGVYHVVNHRRFQLGCFLKRKLWLIGEFTKVWIWSPNCTKWGTGGTITNSVKKHEQCSKWLCVPFFSGDDDPHQPSFKELNQLS